VRRDYDRHRPNSAMRGFGRPWRRLRESILNRDPLCVNLFGIKDHVALSTDVDHILPVAQGGTEDASNLQGLCHSCHSRKTANEVGFGGQEGRGVK
jgi:5-methylcytosine-specific restriction protein A